MRGRLNIFQKSMLQWNELHAYNAAHVVRVPGAMDLERLRAVITRTLEAQGLARLALDRREGTYEYQAGVTSAELTLTLVDSAELQGLSREIERQLNTPFSEESCLCPFRFFVAPGADSFSLGLVYFHPVADAESILFLLKEIFASYTGQGSSVPAQPFDRYPPGRDNLLRHRPEAFVKKLLSVPSLVRSLRRSYRPNYRDPEDLQNKFVLFSLAPETLAGMARMAKSLGVTLNDFFLALLMRAVSSLTPDRTSGGRRREISLGCIVNTRKDLGLSGRPIFGLVLGSFVVHHPVPPGMELAELTRDIGRQTAAIKRGRLYLGAVLELYVGTLMNSRLSLRHRKKLYQKNYPLWGGVSNMDLNPLWSASGEGCPVDYIRAVSTGPVTPLVLSITTTGRVAHVGLTYRSTVFSPGDIEQVTNCFRLDPAQMQEVA